MDRQCKQEGEMHAGDDDDDDDYSDDKYTWQPLKRTVGQPWPLRCIISNRFLTMPGANRRL